MLVFHRAVPEACALSEHLPLWNGPFGAGVGAARLASITSEDLAPLPDHTPTIDPERTDRLAEVEVKMGLGLRPGQELILTAPLTAVPLVRRIVEHAYRAGAGMVTPLYADAASALAL